MGVLSIFIIIYLIVFKILFLRAFIIRYYPVKKPIDISLVVRISSVIMLFLLLVFLWTSPLPLSSRIIGIIGCALIFIFALKSIKEKKIPIFEKIIIFPAYYASMYFGYVVIGLKYISFIPYTYKVICPACFRLNKPKDSKKYERENYLGSFSFKSENELLKFNRNDPFYINGYGRLRFGRKQRFCKYCGGTLMAEGPYFTLVCIFGDNIKEEWDKQTFVLKNPDPGHRDSPIDFSALYIDPVTTDIKKLERFVTFVMNYPPRGKPEDLAVYYYGDLAPLGDHMKNLLKNTFKRLQRRGDVDHV